ncbi:SDR family oxidoreductase [Pseudoruegeria sp. HB172150]|uniref:SDR family oxidoreductase n=1 Tax=Pseudoruegeria sp. HB172150 TaxID=2721164 RepID=UPI001554810C|nr:SDR family oxidoreductase [Pseudoruegeria sp. HB172150]
MNTVMITGSSSGYGLETACYFHAQGWTVIATMRDPRASSLPVSERIQVLPLDVTDANSIAAAVEAAGPIDALVNNAGIGLIGAVEATPMPLIRQIFDTNTFGTIAMCQAVIPQMRERQSGTIINVTSSATLTPMPLAALYTASKQAIEGFTGSLAHELGYFGVRARLVEPGYGPTTRFAANSQFRIADLIPDAYAGFAGPIFEAFAGAEVTTRESDVAEAVWLAAQDRTDRLRYAAGADAVALALAG